jgi:signal transduction histidine kinase
MSRWHIVVRAKGGVLAMPDDRFNFDYVRNAERLRIAQQLHDSTSQLLAVLQLTLGRMRRQGVECLEANIAECEEIIAQIGGTMREIGKGD